MTDEEWFACLKQIKTNIERLLQSSERQAAAMERMANLLEGAEAGARNMRTYAP